MKLILEFENTEKIVIEEKSFLYEPIKAIDGDDSTSYDASIPELSKIVAIASLHAESDEDIKEHAKIAEVLSQARDLDVFTIRVSE